MKNTVDKKGTAEKIRNARCIDSGKFDWCMCMHTLVPEAFFYSLLANFATRTASYIFFIGTKLRAEKRKPLVATVGEPHFHAISF